jgi:hypothetical protein
VLPPSGCLMRIRGKTVATKRYNQTDAVEIASHGRNMLFMQCTRYQNGTTKQSPRYPRPASRSSQRVLLCGDAAVAASLLSHQAPLGSISACRSIPGSLP